jgi:DNA repair protein RecN (Recombination protein N)
MLRPGAEEGRVSGLFDVRDPAMLKDLGAAADMDIAADGGEILLTRRLYASGRSSVSLNGNPITLAMLKNVAELLVDVHGQHDHQFLLKPSNQLGVLDEFAQAIPLRDKYHAVYAQLAEARQRLDELSATAALRKQQLDLYSFQADEIDNAELDAAEYAELQSRATMLRNLERLKRHAAAAHEALYEADGSIVERLRGMSGVLAEASELDDKLKPIAQTIRDTVISLEEAAFDLSRYLDRLDVDPSEIGEVDNRLNVINRVLAKYGDSIETVVAYREEIGRKIDELRRDTTDSSTLQNRITPLLDELKTLGTQLSAARRKAGDRLCPLIERQLVDLGMEKARFTVCFAPAPPTISGVELPATANGFDSVEFTIQTNPGQLAQPLRKIASGGELSRIMLALKSILAASDRVSVLVFDEIDSNVGGRLGSVIGEKLRALGEHHQILCITHLPQIACYANRHLTVRKQVNGNATATTVRVMEGDERLQELAAMIGGQHITPTTLAQVQELLDLAARPAAKSKSKPAEKPRKAKA